MAVDVLFINPGNRRKTYQALGDEFSAVDTPTWALLAAGHLRSRGRTVALYDANAEGWDDTTASELCARHAPKLVVLLVFGNHPSASTQTMPAAGMIARLLKQAAPDIPVAMGGTHPSALPERTLREEVADFVIQGEGPRTVDRLVDLLDGKLSRADVPGLWWLDGDDVRNTPPATVFADLDTDLPGYAWDLLPDINRYRAHNWHCFQEFERSRAPDFSDVRTPYASIYTSLGCPYNCSFCCINALFGKPGIRYWSLENVLATLETLNRTYGVRNIRFADELFILDPKRVERFCDMVVERGLDLNIWVYGRVDTTKPGVLSKLKRAGVNWIALGIEAANEAVQSSVNKRIKVDITDVVRSIQAAGINVIGNYMFGLPEDSVATMEETLRLALRLNCEFVNMYAVMAYPGSKLYDEAAARPGVLPSTWNGFSHHAYETQPLPTNHLTPAEVLRFRDEAFTRAMTDPAYIDRVGRLFGPKVVDHLHRMMQIPLKRKLLEGDAR